MLDDSGVPTDHFMDWCLATAHLNEKNWAYGFERVKMKMSADLANNKDPWPPSTPAIFVAMCFPNRGEIAAASGNAEASYKRHPNLVARDQEQTLCIEDSGRKGRINQAHNKAMGQLKDLL